MEFIKNRDLSGLENALETQSFSRLFNRRSVPNPVLTVVNSFPEAIPVLVKHGADPNMRSSNLTPMQFAVLVFSDSIEYLYKAGVDVYTPMPNGKSYVTLAASRKAESLGVFIKLGVDINKKDSNGDAPIHVANKESTKLLLQQPTLDINATDANGNTVLHIFAGKYPDSLALVLENKSVSVNAINNLGRTPAHVAAMFNEKCLEILLKKGVDVNIKDSKGKTVADVATPEGLDLLNAVYKNAEINKENKQLTMDNAEMAISKLKLANIKFHVIEHKLKFFETSDHYLSISPGIGKDQSELGVSEMIILHDKKTKTQIGRCLVGFDVNMFEDKFLAKEIGPMIDLYEISVNHSRKGYGTKFFKYIVDYYKNTYGFDRIYAVGILPTAFPFWSKMGMSKSPNLPIDAMMLKI